MAGTYGHQQLFTESVSAVTATNTVALGTRRVEGGNEYLYVYNAGSTAAVGYGVIASANSGYSVTITSVMGNLPLGVVQSNDLTASYYGWVQTKGFVHVYWNGTAANGTAAIGDAVVLGANGGFDHVVTALAGGTHGVIGYSVSEIATAGTGTIYLRGC